jgi:hypothetical protein
MARNDIRLDQIQARLGDMSKPRHYDGYDDLPHHDDEYETPRTFNAGFIASILGLFLAVSGGTFYFSSAGNPLKGLSVSSVFGSVPASFKSRADVACGGHWAKGGRNDQSILCYLTTDVERLCDANERTYLANKVSQYRTDRNIFDAKAVAKGFNSMGSLNGALKQTFSELQSNIDSFDNSNDRPMNANERAQRRNSRHSNHGVEPGSALVAAFGGFNDLTAGAAPDGSIAQSIRKLAVQGYMTKWDFGLLPDGLVVRAFTELPEGVRNMCNR